MRNEISLFSGYDQKENRTTNYCLLALKLIYEENPKLLGEALAALVGEELADVVGVQVKQQARKQSSTPDGVIFQSSFLKLYIETKRAEQFSNDQLERHLKELDQEESGTKVLLALGNFQGLAANDFAGIEALCKTQLGGRVFFKAVSFEELIDALPVENVSKNLRDTLDEFESYLDAQGLLPRWKTRLDVVNCSGLPAEVTEGGVYMCPAQGGAYKHMRAKYFGMYQSKAVRRVANIDAVVRFDEDGTAMLQWANKEAAEAELIDRAKEKRDALRPGAAIRVFLLGDLFETDFRKTSSGGLQSSKLYFDIGPLEAKDAEDLAAKLRGKSWDDLRR